MSSRDADDLDRKIAHDELPDITSDEILALVKKYLADAPKLESRLLQDVYNDLRPAGWMKRYKTNDKYAVGYKVITRQVEYGRSFWSVGHYSQDQLIAIDRVFHLLDGKLNDFDAKGYRSPLVDAINTTPHSRNTGETVYFKFALYQNGNIHLTFKRHDLVDELNRRMGATSLRGQ